MVSRTASCFAILATLAVAASFSADSAANDSGPDSDLETIVRFDPSRLETPESMVIDASGTMYVSLALTGEIRKIKPNGQQSTFATLPLGGPPLTTCGAFVGIMGALATDHHHNLYASLASCDPDARGIWRIRPNGDAGRIAALDVDALPNGIAYRDGDVYVADSALGVVWRAPADGSGEAEVWASDPAFLPGGITGFPGLNGAQFFEDELYVANSDTGTIFAIPVDCSGDAGPPRVHAQGVGCDDFAFDVEGSLYCTTDPFNTVVRVDPDGSSEVILTAADGLDGPSSTIFGKKHGDRMSLYITNAAFPFFSQTHQPSIMRLSLDVRGAPRN